MPASASSESSRSRAGDGRRAWSLFLRFLTGDHGLWGPCRGILYSMPLSESMSTRGVSNDVGVCGTLCHVNDEIVCTIEWIILKQKWRWWLSTVTRSAFHSARWFLRSSSYNTSVAVIVQFTAMSRAAVVDDCRGRRVVPETRCYK